MNDYQKFIYKRTYSRWKPELKRRETWDETVSRYAYHFVSKVPEQLRATFDKAIESIRNLNLMPSMRCLWSAGSALEKENISGFNCAYTMLDKPRKFAEVLYILMCGTGISISVERQVINKLPEIPDRLGTSPCDDVICVDDSRKGWAQAVEQLITALYEGRIPRWDLSRVRPKGARLKTFGGRASGPAPLNTLLKFIVKTFEAAKGRKLTSDECSDILCMIARCVIVGGVRRSAIMLLTNPSDERMANYKKGAFWVHHDYRAFANVSAIFSEKPDSQRLLKFFTDLIGSGTGERGIISREALNNASPFRQKRGDYGLNPCGEVVLKPNQFCNLTEVVLRPGIKVEEVESLIQQAVLLGLLQAQLTDFGFIGPEWKANAEEEVLLGVSLTGLADVGYLSPELQRRFSSFAWRCALEFSYELGMKLPAAICCVKPSGTVSQLVDASSGIHSRFSPYYIRRVRVAKTDPICTFLREQGVPCKPEVGFDMDTAYTFVFEFPINNVNFPNFRFNGGAISQLHYWKEIKENWCDHNPSATIYVKDEEWPEVIAWVNRNWHSVAGLSFLPYDTGVYELAPYEEITKEEYEKLMSAFPKIQWGLLDRYEVEDHTTGGREMACAGGGCEI